MKKNAYPSVAVNEVQLAKVLAGREDAPVDVGCDIGKDSVLVMLRWGEGDLEKPWRARNPSELTRLRDLLVELSRGRRLRIGMEPTGTYGDPLRQVLADAGLRVLRIGTKAAHDYAEVFDGVPSQHDGKDAAVVAELVALGKGRDWPFTAGDAWEQELRYWVSRLVVETRQLQQWVGRLEGLLMRHWPELSEQRRLTSVTLLQAVVEHGDPRRLAGDATAGDKLWRWSRGPLVAGDDRPGGGGGRFERGRAVAEVVAAVAAVVRASGVAVQAAVAACASGVNPPGSWAPVVGSAGADGGPADGVCAVGVPG